MPYLEADDRRILFVHIPKTGGTSIEAWLESFGPLQLSAAGVPEALRTTPQHLTYHDIRTLFAEDYFDFAFAVVRNPFARLESEYRMHQQMRTNAGFAQPAPFNTWLDLMLRKVKSDRHVHDNHLRPQWQFVSKKVVVYKLEDGLQAILRDVAKRTGLAPPKEIPHKLKTDAQETPVHWDVRETAAVQEFYDKDFEFFEYDTAPPGASSGRPVMAKVKAGVGAGKTRGAAGE